MTILACATYVLYMKKKTIPLHLLYLLLPLGLLGCNEQPTNEQGLAGTHPELAEELREDSLTVPYADSSDLYNRYRITTDEYLNSRKYGVGNYYEGKLADLDEKSHPEASRYGTMLQQGLQEGVNFAGKYTVISIGCGTSCQQHFVVDRESGQVLDKLQGSMGARYSRESRLFILNPPDAETDYSQCQDCAPQAYVFEEGKFRKVEN